MTYEDLHWLRESLKTICNHAYIAIILLDLGKMELLPTVLEEMQEDIQDIMDEHCIVRE